MLCKIFHPQFMSSMLVFRRVYGIQISQYTVLLTSPPQIKLARARDETMRLLKLYLSRAWRVIHTGVINTASRAR